MAVGCDWAVAVSLCLGLGQTAEPSETGLRNVVAVTCRNEWLLPDDVVPLDAEM